MNNALCRQSILTVMPWWEPGSPQIIWPVTGVLTKVQENLESASPFVFWNKRSNHQVEQVPGMNGCLAA
jgi:hypothetical protein